MKYQLALVYGGCSVEHEVSVLTALHIAKYLPEEFDVILVYYDKHQHFYIGESLSDPAFYQELDYTHLSEVIFEYKNFLTYLKPKALFRKRIQIDIVLPLVHGTSGEDGTLQGLFETMQLPYCQSSLVSCAMGMDKEITKKWLRAHELPTVEERIFYREDVASDIDKLEECDLPFPWILKPAHGGSSIGIQCADADENLIRKALECFAFDQKLLIETKLKDHREFNIAVLGDRDNQIASHIEEVFKSEEILSYQDKYGGSRVKNAPQASAHLPADISIELKEEMTALAIQAFKAFDCSGVVRIDFFLHEGKLYINELNMIPGSLSLYLFEGLIEKKEILSTILLLGFKKYRLKMREIRRIESPLLKQDLSLNMLKK